MHTDPNYVLVMRPVKNMTSHGASWAKEAGWWSVPLGSPSRLWLAGLHGFLWGEGTEPTSWDPDAVWMIVKVRATDIVILDDGDKVKFPRGEVIL